MIRFSLHCAEGHDFDSWFASGAAFDDLQRRGLVSCAVCGSAKVEKALMAPAVSATRPLAEPQSQIEQAMAALRAEIEANSEYVGMNFAAEARAIHDGEAPTRAIYGEARPDEARKLLEDGVPVAPLPFLPARKTN
ncbi:DUF1178 family protein [Gemmobacter denitrificans]|uniref:DUF1178 family protein n=1 Tax=Gemmobacter denitrificans TaxID=3123040 RepID=A0ABU8BYF0_9RHOB